MKNHIVTLADGPHVGQRWFRNGEICESIADEIYYQEQLRKNGAFFEVRAFHPADSDETDSDETGWDEWGEVDDEFVPSLTWMWDFLMSDEATPTEGRKDDQAKVRLDLLPFDAVTAAADVMTWRCTKSTEVPNPYPERNWEKGMNWHRLFRAALGHLWDWWMQKDDGRGPGRDKESGRSHLAHALCCVLFLMAYELRKIGPDDRPLVNK